MDVESFLNSLSKEDLRFSITEDRLPSRSAPETIDALFHLPLLALVVMVIATQATLSTVLLGRKVALLLVEHFSALRHSPQGLEASLTLRRRCADALAYLEAANLVTVSNDPMREIALTQAGKKRLEAASRNVNDLGLMIRQLRISQRRATARSSGDER
ncbi:hypothetical protein [Xanthomonas cannabis]|uniref:hypothetical protein n=1 Tax=Xanthomonas cannabis TaxID=1885674 RepID=UPI00141AD4ED|nr:hypothetical protein [Xanthomonas cannabis]NIK63518.1 hypothetical protein [Xanthomonas cannabis]